MKYFSILFYGPLIFLGLCVFVVSLALQIFGKWKRGPSAGIMTSLCLIAFCLLSLQNDGILGLGVPREFSAESWARTNPEDRHFMVDSLLNDVNFSGMTSDELRQLLGAPDYIDTPGLMEDVMEYVIDKPFDVSTLDFYIKNGVVSDVTITPEH